MKLSLTWPPRFWLHLRLARQESMQNAAREQLRYLYAQRAVLPGLIRAYESMEWRHEHAARVLRAKLGLGLGSA